MKGRFLEKRECTGIKTSMANLWHNIVCVEPEGRLILEDETQTKRGYMFKEVEYLLK